MTFPFSLSVTESSVFFYLKMRFSFRFKEKKIIMKVEKFEKRKEACAERDCI